MEVAFWVQMSGGPPISQREMHMLQPMHSLMSSRRPSSILLGRKGSAIEGRAAPMMSAWPEVTICAMSSGLVTRPTPSTGTLAMLFTSLTQGFWWLAL